MSSWTGLLRKAQVRGVPSTLAPSHSLSCCDAKGAIAEHSMLSHWHPETLPEQYGSRQEHNKGSGSTEGCVKQVLIFFGAIFEPSFLLACRGNTSRVCVCVCLFAVNSCGVRERSASTLMKSNGGRSEQKQRSSTVHPCCMSDQFRSHNAAAGCFRLSHSIAFLLFTISFDVSKPFLQDHS